MVNKVILVGRLGHDPETKYLPDGKAVTNFNVATSTKYGGEEQTEWHRCTAFGKLAEICGEYLTKGKLVYVEGRKQTREYDGKDGTKKKDVSIIVNEMKMLDGKSSDKKDDDEEAPF